MRSLISLFAFLALLALPSAFAAPAGAAPAGGNPAAGKPAMDTVAIHTMYLEGDFERATGILEKALGENRLATHEDSIFAFKHLGVMYAADNNSREKGKYYMLQLVTMEPTARIMDMYASDMIYMIFKNIQEEYEVTKGKMIRAERHVAGNQGTAATQAPDAARPAGAAAAASTPPSHRGRNYLIAGGAVAALVGAGITAHYLLEEEPTAGKTNHEIDR